MSSSEMSSSSSDMSSSDGEDSYIDAEDNWVSMFRRLGRRIDGIDDFCREERRRLGDNIPNQINLTHLCKMLRDDQGTLSESVHFIPRFSDEAWQRLGRYVARNDQLRVFNQHVDGLTDRQMAQLFSELPCSASLTELNLYPVVSHDSHTVNDFGIESIERMAPFLRDSRRLESFSIGHAARLDNACFRLIVDALNGGTIQKISVKHCNVTDITALQDCTLPNLTVLDLGFNEIGDNIPPSLEQYTTLHTLRLDKSGIGLAGCRSIADLLRNGSCSLRVLSLRDNSVCDEAAEVLAEALKHNSTLQELDITVGQELDIGDPSIRIGERGCLAFLRLLNDGSSIANTYNSNHTLVTVKIPPSQSNPDVTRMKKPFGWALDVNNHCKGNPEKAGQIKVLQSQLNSIGRQNMCLAQGIEFLSTGSILAGIDSCLLPNVLALMGRYSRDDVRDEVFNALVEMAPDLMALIDKRAMMTDLLEAKQAQIDIHRAQIAALTVETDSLSKRLRLLKGGGDEPETKKMRRR